jgi:hypothetical protein
VIHEATGRAGVPTEYEPRPRLRRLRAGQSASDHRRELFGNRIELRDLITVAGFRDVRIFLGVGQVRYPSVEELLRWEGASSPLARPIGALTNDVRAALIHDVSEALRTYTDDGIVFPTETYLAVARR